MLKNKASAQKAKQGSLLAHCPACGALAPGHEWPCDIEHAQSTVVLSGGTPPVEVVGEDTAAHVGTPGMLKAALADQPGTLAGDGKVHLIVARHVSRKTMQDLTDRLNALGVAVLLVALEDGETLTTRSLVEGDYLHAKGASEVP